MSDRSKYIFKLFAPYNKKANLLAGFNDWEPLAMEKSDDGYFRYETELADGKYEYRFEIQTKSWFFEEDEWKTLTDPYATEVDGETQNAVLRLKNGEKIVDEYEWRHNDVELPENDDLIIYEMHVGDFSGGEKDAATRGKYTDVIDKLDYLKELGITAIELMPVKESPGDFSWGYSPLHYFAVEGNYGASFELKELIDKAHGAGIRLFVDGVYNHANSEMPLTRIDHDYWFHHEPKDPEHNWGPEFNYDYTDEKLGVSPARKFIFDTIKFWLEEYQIDGIRYDGVRQMDNWNILKDFDEYTHKLHDFKPFFNVAEHIPVDPEITKPAGPMDSCWNDSFMFGVFGNLTGEEFSFENLKDAIDPRRIGFDFPTSVVNYLCNHDHNRLLGQFGDLEIFGEEAFRRAKLGASILFTAVGIPMIWMGEEFGEYKEKSPESNKINWGLLENDENKQLLEFYKILINLRKMNPALKTANVEFFFEDEDSKVLAFQRFGDDNEVIVILNLSENNLEEYVVKNFPSQGVFRDWLTDTEFEINDSDYPLNIKPFEAKILVR